MRKKLIIVTIIIVIGLLWYFFIKPQDYQIRVEAKSLPGTINQSLKAWNNSLNDASIIQLEDIKHLKQTIIFGDSTFIYTWNISPINDSTSQLKVDVKDVNHSLKNRLYIPFMDTNFEKGSRKFVTEFIKNLNQHRKEFKVTILEVEELPSTYCACVMHKTSQTKKAIGMKESYPFLNSVLVGNGLKLNGVPFIETTDWDMANDSVANNIKVDAKPIEFFFNNPNMGGDALLWKTEVFMPLLDSDE